MATRDEVARALYETTTEIMPEMVPWEALVQDAVLDSYYKEMVDEFYAMADTAIKLLT